jgi:hypothetical protein
VQGDWAANAAIVTRTIASFDAPWAERPFPPPGTCTARGTPSLTLVRPREAPRSIEALADSPVQRSNPGHISTTRVLQLAATPGESCRSRSVSPATTSLIAAQADRLDHFAKVRVAGSSPVARSGKHPGRHQLLAYDQPTSVQGVVPAIFRPCGLRSLVNQPADAS